MINNKRMRILWLVNKNSQNDIKFEGLFKSDCHKVITCKSCYDEKEKNNFEDTDALVVQINLEWDREDTFDGIRLVQELRLSDNINIPIVFLSLSLSRKDILHSNPSLDIISTFGLSNGFCFKNGDVIDFTLPVDVDKGSVKSIDDYIKLLPRIDAVRRFDNKYFCRKEDQIRRLRHDIAYNGVEQIKNKLIKLFDDDARISNATTREELYGLCNTLERELRANEVEQTQENATRVLILDDKYDEDKGIKFFLEYSRKMLDIKCCKTVKEALDIIKNFNPNVVLVDLRLQDSTKYPIINKQQGYDYLNIHKESYPHIGVIILSRLPMSFLKDLSRNMNHFRTFYWKKELEGTIYCDILIQSINELAVTRFKNDTPQKKEFEEFYNWWYGIDTNERISDKIKSDSDITGTYEQFVDDKSQEIIKSIVDKGVFVSLDKSGGTKLSNPNFEELRLQSGWKKDVSLSKLFIFRRVATYLFYYLHENVETDEAVSKAFYEVKNYNKNSDSRYTIAIERYTAEIVNRILINNWNTNKNSITNKFLFFKGKSGNRIYSYKDISLTKEEKEFFSSYFPHFFNAWDQKR